MIRPLFALALLALATPARADVTEAVDQVILPGYARFTEATAALAALDICDPGPLRAGWNAAFDGWLGVAHLRLGPVEDEGRVLAIAFWPDPKGIGPKQTATLLREADPAKLSPDQIAEQSVAVRGLFGLERLLYPAEPLAGDYPCALIHALADDLARMAAETEAGWTGGFADQLKNPGTGQRYLTQTEARQALLTVLITGLEFNADSRINRPKGSFDQPRPERAEARASGRSIRNITLSLQALRELAHALHQDIPQTEAAFLRALTDAEKADLSAVGEPQGWLKADILAQDIHAIRDAAMAEIAPALGASVGFNAADGD